MKPHFRALLTFSTDTDGEGRSPVSSGYRAGIQFSFMQAPLIAIFSFPEDELVFPGDSLTAEIIIPEWNAVAGKLYEGLDFDFFENVKLIGHGTVTRANFKL